MTPKLGCRGQKIERSLNFWREPLGLFHYTLLLQGEGQCGAECDVSVSKLLGLETFPIFGIVSDSVSKNLVSKKVSHLVSEKNWYREKYRIWYRKIWYEKNYRIRYRKLFGIKKSMGFGIRKYLVSEKRFGFGFVQILGIVTHWSADAQHLNPTCCTTVATPRQAARVPYQIHPFPFHFTHVLTTNYLSNNAADSGSWKFKES